MNLAQRPRTPTAFLTPRKSATPAVVRGVLAVLIVIAFGLLVARTSYMTHSDLAVSTALNSVHTGLLGAVASGAYVVFGPVPAVVATMLIAAAIWLVSGNFRPAVTFGTVVAVTWLSSALVKVLVDRPRPDAALLPHPAAVPPIDASYPSGHAVFVTALVVTLVMLARDRPVQPLVMVLGGVLVALVGLALVIDGVHYISDVLASILWSVGLAPLVLDIWNRVVLPRTYGRTARGEEPA